MRVAWCFPFLLSLTASLEEPLSIWNGCKSFADGGKEGSIFGDFEKLPGFFFIDFDLFISLRLLLFSEPREAISSSSVLLT